MWRCLILLFVVLDMATLSAAEHITLTDTEGRNIVGQVLEISDTEVRFQAIDRQPVSIPLTRLSEGSRAIVRKMKSEGLFPAGSWPVRGAITAPHKPKVNDRVWTGSHVRLVFPYEPVKANVSSSPEAAFLRSVDTAIAAAKAIPLGLIEPKRIFECRVVSLNDFIAMTKARREKLSPRLPWVMGMPFGESAPRLAGSGTHRLTPQIHYDEDADVLYVTIESLDEFLTPDRGSIGSICPIPERHRIVREAAVKMAFGKNHDRIPLSLRSAWSAYFATIDSALGPELDYGKLSGGLKKLVRRGVPSSGLEDAEFIKLDPAAAAADLAAGRIPQGYNGALVIYYLLHLDHSRKAVSLGGLFRTPLPEDEAIRLACDRYRADVAAFKDKAAAYNQALKTFFSRGGMPDGTPKADNPRPALPVPPAASLEEFLGSSPMRALAVQAESKRLTILFRNRSNTEVATDFSAMMTKAVR